MTLIVMKRGGQAGTVAINPDLVTYVRSSSGPFTDVHFGEHHVSVEGTFDQVVARLTSDARAGIDKPAIKSWIRTP